jgi:protein-L-isoaspartate(D-aspartate) O-methyltransferase
MLFSAANNSGRPTLRAATRAALVAAGLLMGSIFVTHADEWAAPRRRMVAEVRAMMAEAAGETRREQLSERVAEAMERVPRHEFVPMARRHAAYDNRPLPIGHGQTISQPFIVALMTDLLELTPEARVLEIGTGSGYQAAVLSLLAKEVFSIEIVRPLGEEAARTLARLGYANVTTRVGDGYGGWPEAAPFDGIIVTAAAGHVPPALIAQLRPGGRLVIPVGDFSQELMVIEKTADGTLDERRIVPVAFVPFTREGERK